jgi:hypothetical protein
MFANPVFQQTSMSVPTIWLEEKDRGGLTIGFCRSSGLETGVLRCVIMKWFLIAILPASEG